MIQQHVSTDHDMKYIKNHNYHGTIDYFGKKYIILFCLIHSSYYAVMIESNYLPLDISEELFD